MIALYICRSLRVMTTVRVLTTVRIKSIRTKKFFIKIVLFIEINLINF